MLVHLSTVNHFRLSGQKNYSRFKNYRAEKTSARPGTLETQRDTDGVLMDLNLRAPAKLICESFLT